MNVFRVMLVKGIVKLQKKKKIPFENFSYGYGVPIMYVKMLDLEVIESTL